MKGLHSKLLPALFYVHLLWTVLVSLDGLYGQIPIAVIQLEANGITEVEASALTDRLRNELFKIGSFEVLERSFMNEILAEQGFQQTGCTSDECLVEVGKLIGVRQMVGGSVTRVGDVISVSARLVDVESGKLLRVSDLDHEGELKDLLRTGMTRVAMEVSGIPIFEKQGEPAQTGFRYYFDRLISLFKDQTFLSFCSGALVLVLIFG